MKTSMLELLSEYFAKNSKEKIMADWKAVEQYSKVGPPVEVFLKDQKKLLDELEQQVSWVAVENRPQIVNENPEYSSDFFYICELNTFKNEKSIVFFI